MKQFRLNRLFSPHSGRCFDVAIDHGFFGEYEFLNGIADISAAVATVAQAGPDAVQLTVGQAKYLQRIHDTHKPALVLRADIANVYGNALPTYPFSKMIDEPVLQAVRLDAVCICVNLFQIPGAPEVTAQCIDNILKIKTDAEHYAMPIMIEPLVFRPNSEKGGYMVDGDLKKIMPLVRQAVELGADIIKADPTDVVDDYHKVVQVAGEIPVLVRGGGRAPDQEILTRTKGLMEQGVKGIVYGRNIIQHEAPELITKALMGIVHNGLSVDEAMEILSLKKEIQQSQKQAIE